MDSFSRRIRLRGKLDRSLYPTNSVSDDDSQNDSLHPELEDQPLVAWGMAQSELKKDPSATIDVLYGRELDLSWRYGVDDKDLESILVNASQPDNKSQRYVQMMIQAHLQHVYFPVLDIARHSTPLTNSSFINTLSSKNGWLPGNFSIQPNTIRILKKAGLSAVVLSSVYDPEGTWAKMGNQCFQRYDDDGSLSSFEIAYRYTCGWESDTGTGFTQFTRTRNLRTYFCINYPSAALDRFKEDTKRTPSLVYRDFFLDALCEDDCLKGWQHSISERRELLLDHELKYEHGDIDFNVASLELHRVSRDWHTLGQDCLDVHAQLLYLKTSYTKYVEILTDAKNGWEVDRASDMGNSLGVLASQCDNYARWTAVYRDRTIVRINLLFHLANQREAQTNTQIAASTAKVAEQTQRDSASMITIAAVTMVFLPGTFISAILSTTFFDYGANGLSVSKTWWILPATTIPLTVLVFGIWLSWRYLKLGRANLDSKLP